ncbi:MAG: hypothetical protein ACLUI3_08830 [Christensenellales bacterium]
MDQVSRAMDRLDDDEKGSVKVPHPKARQTRNERRERMGLVIWCCARKSEARRSLDHARIPDIAETGISCDETMTDEELLDKALAIAKQKIAERERSLN